MKESGTHKEYLSYCALLLHSETVSNLSYYKGDRGAEVENCLHLQGLINDGRGRRISVLIKQVHNFLSSGDVEAKMRTLSAIVDPTIISPELTLPLPLSLPLQLPPQIPAKSPKKSPSVAYWSDGLFRCPDCPMTTLVPANLRRHMKKYE